MGVSRASSPRPAANKHIPLNPSLEKAKMGERRAQARLFGRAIQPFAKFSTYQTPSNGGAAWRISERRVIIHVRGLARMSGRERSKIMGALRVSIEIGDLQASNFETVETLVDTGAVYTMIPRSILTGLGISPSWQWTLALADGREREFDMANAAVRLNGVSVTTIVIFGEEGAAPSLGAYTLTGLGLMVDPFGHWLVELVGHL